MANEITANVSIAYDDGKQDDTLTVVERQLTSTGKRFTKLVQNVGFAAEEALQLGELTAPGSLILVNLDETNAINVKVATSGAIFAQLLPDTDGDGKGGYCAIDRMGSGAQAPFVIALVAACRMAVLVVEV